MMSRLWAWTLAAAASSALHLGCIESMVLNGQINATRRAAVAFDTVGDFEVAYSALSASIVQFEGMHHLAPDNEDALFMLAQGWTGLAYGFIEDDLERAEDAGERSLAEMHKKRAVEAYDRAIRYGKAHLAKTAEGFENAIQSEETLHAWLERGFQDQEDAQILFWLGYAWVSRTNVLKDDAEAVAQVFVGAKLLERSIALDPGYYHGAASVVLAAYHARSAMAELDQAKQMFDGLLAKNPGFLLTKLQYATRYACAKSDGELYKKLLDEILAVEHFDDDLRLMNTLAQRRARRWLGTQRMFDACGIELPGGSENAS